MEFPFPIIDSHLHLWDYPGIPHPWLAAIPQFRQTFDLACFRGATMEVPTSGMMAVESAVAPQYALREVAWLEELAATDERIMGIIAAAPVEAGTALPKALFTLRQDHPLVRGVRRAIQDEPDPAFCLRSEFIEGVQTLADFDYSFDLCIRHEQLPSVTELVRQCPQVRFILNHLGKPPLRYDMFAPWNEHLAAVASLPNVACKLSGLLTEVVQGQSPMQAIAPFVAHALAVFGPERVLFGSDWPVMTLAAGYRDWMTLLDRLTSHLPAIARQQLWGNNARHWYRLPEIRPIN